MEEGLRSRFFTFSEILADHPSTKNSLITSGYLVAKTLWSGHCDSEVKFSLIFFCIGTKIGRVAELDIGRRTYYFDIP